MAAALFRRIFEALVICLILFDVCRCSARVVNESIPVTSIATTASECAPITVGKCAPGLLLPVWPSPSNASLTSSEAALRGSVYFAALLYLFIGVAIASDVFMSAIEVITSQERSVVVVGNNGEQRTVQVRVWNEAVANLTLMALGTSCPEILLSAIEICKNGFIAGDLGPGTIVGSAAYNLFVIPAVCVIAVGPTAKRVHHQRVFFCTAIWSIVAYVWLYLIVVQISPGVVEVWEALVTLLGFPATALSTYLVDCTRKWNQHQIVRNNTVVAAGVELDVEAPQLAECVKSPEGLCEDTELAAVQTDTAEPTETAESDDAQCCQNSLLPESERAQNWAGALRTLHQSDPKQKLEAIVRRAERRLLYRKKKSRAFYRMQTVAKFTAGPDLLDVLAEQNRAEADMESGSQAQSRSSSGSCSGSDSNEAEASADGDIEAGKDDHLEQNHDSVFRASVEFVPNMYVVSRSVGSLAVTVRKVGATKAELVVSFATNDGTAVSGVNYEPVSDTLHFAPSDSEETQQITLNILNSPIDEKQRQFLVKLQVDGVEENAAITDECVILISDDEEVPCTFDFEEEEVEFSEATGCISLPVRRFGLGESRCVYLPFRTVEATARNCLDFEPVNGELQFDADCSSKTVSVQLINTEQYEKNVFFFVELDEPSLESRAASDACDDAAPKSEGAADVAFSSLSRVESMQQRRLQLGTNRRIKVIIRASSKFRDAADHLKALSEKPVCIRRHTRWRKQFHEALFIDAESSNICSIVTHYLVMPLKLLVAFVPPPTYANGWLCFLSSLFIIGILTALIGDVASHFGCSIGLRDAVTAITFVAIGTSVPDTFASRIASITELHADNAIGNVTGSSAVNVFLGIGLAWLLASIYWTAKQQPFRVEPGSLGFAVGLYCIFALACLGVLVLRRSKSVGGELGGPTVLKWATFAFMVLLWFSYILFSALDYYCIISTGF